MHEITAHFAILLASAVPITALLGLIFSPHNVRLILGVALSAMILATTLIFIASATGEAEMAMMQSGPIANAALAEHRNLAETTRELFTVLTIVFAALFFGPNVMGREFEHRINSALWLVYLIFYASGAVFLFHTAVQGGHLLGQPNVRNSSFYGRLREGARR